MPLFSLNKTKSLLGLDIGSSSIKLVELKHEQERFQLVTYGLIEQSRDIIKSDPEKAKKEVSHILKNLLKKARVTTDRVVAVLPGFSIFSSVINLPTMSDKELKSAIQWEAKKLVPIPSEEMILDWKIVRQANQKIEPQKPNKKDKAKKNIPVFLTATSKNIVDRYVDIINKAELQLIALETQSSALQRSLAPFPKNEIMIVDMGTVYTDIIIFSNGIPTINKTIDTGGETISTNIMNTLNINLARAEQFKYDFGLSERGIQMSQVKNAIEFVISSVVTEIKHMINIYQRQNKKQVQAIILSGGSSLLADLPEYLEDSLNIEVHIGNPWSQISYPQELNPTLEKIGPRMSTAIGLAMRSAS